ncbi:hypothetical protein Metig_1464 [Methanotorris igneus Kol 5]|uniref:Uncharacterized protein n=2 Tax=Methanotorris igneus TaxID=2189 RepID=F6BAI6_METIK|nr:hypothetical protein Metig_1464 [Methanotorris igneus Kol 5]
MEIGILVASSIVVATIASYYYITNYLNSHPENAGKSANKTIIKINKTVYSEVKDLNDTSTGW